MDEIIYRFRTCPARGVPVPKRYGPWRDIWRRDYQLSARGEPDSLPGHLF